ncbi:MAG: hypothetical protein ABI882_20480, partial [Acidobacteriota bacterium]
CIALAFGQTAAKMIRAQLSGLIGLLAAPSAFIFAKSVHGVVAQSLDLPVGGASIPPVWAVALIKGIEYAVLGFVVGWIGKQLWSLRRTAISHVSVGLIVGLLFGGTLVLLSYYMPVKTPAIAAILPKALNEVIHPMGCAIVVFASEIFSRRT